MTFAALALGMAAPALAGYALMAANQPVQIGKSILKVTPRGDWNRLGKRVGRNAESWTLDGLTLNDLTFYGGVASGAPLFREVDKVNRPLPHFSTTMLSPDIAQLFEGSYRIANDTSLMAIDAIEPAQFAGHDGFRFTYSFTLQSDEVKRKGEAIGALVGGKLYLITFEAPEIFYFDRDIERFRAIAVTATLG
jgi:hypothetical protein